MFTQRVRLVVADLLKLLERASRERKLTRREQLSVVGVGHAGIFAGAWLIQALFDVGAGLPTGFVVGESLIILACVPFAVKIKLPGVEGYFLQAADPQRPHNSHQSGDKDDIESAEEAAGRVLIAAFIVQFVALGFLLWNSGGPIESPFAELTLAIAVFTPFLANKPITIASVLVLSVLYYAFFIFTYSTTESVPTKLTEYKSDYLAHHPSLWAYFCVNVIILIGALGMTIFESIARSRQIQRLIAAGEANGDYFRSNGPGEFDGSETTAGPDDKSLSSGDSAQ